MSDARFEDGMDKPLRLIAFDAEDLQVVSAMTQDAVWPAAQMALAQQRASVCSAAQPLSAGKRTGASQAERVQSVLSFEDVKAVQTQGFDPQGSRSDPEPAQHHIHPGDGWNGRLPAHFGGRWRDTA